MRQGILKECHDPGAGVLNPRDYSRLSGWQQRWLAETVRLGNTQIPDAAAEAHARNPSAGLSSAQSADSLPDPDQRVRDWAGFIADREGLTQALLDWQQRAVWTLSALLLAALLIGISMLSGTLTRGSGEQINVLLLLVIVLGAHLFTLLLWLLSFRASGEGLSLGRLWLWLSGRFEHKHAANLLRGLAIISTQTGLARWWMGLVSHLFWTFLLTGALAALMLTLALKSYSFVLETTILPEAVFESLVHTLGWLPAQFGLSMPDSDAIRTASQIGSGEVLVQSETQRRAWAAWLLFSLFFYGIFVRLLLASVCALQLASRLRAFRLDLHSPNWNQLSARLSPHTERLGVTDPAPEYLSPQKHLFAMAPDASNLAIVAFELAGGKTWQPTVMPRDSVLFVVDGRQDRQQVLAQLTTGRFSGALMICPASLSPDRGSLHWLSQAMLQVGGVRVWLHGAGSAPAGRVLVWQEVLEEIGVPAAAVFVSDDKAIAWLESGPRTPQEPAR
jgi:hypothetical protein